MRTQVGVITKQVNTLAIPYDNKRAWGQRKLGENSNLITKGTTPVDKSGKGNINFIKIENIENGEIKPISKITEGEHRNYLKRSQLKENDILFSIAGTLGRTAIVKRSILPANTNQALAIIRGYDFEKSFLITAFNAQAVAEYIKKNPTVGAQPNLSLEQVGNLCIFTPTLPEQTAIGSFFRSLDDFTALHQRKLNGLRELKRGYLQQMFPQAGERTPRVRFSGFGGDWEERRLGEVADIIGGGTPDTTNSEYWDGEIDWYSPIEIGKDIYVFSSQRKITKAGLKRSSAKILPAERTILFTSRAGIGDMAILKSPAATNQGFQSLVIKQDYDVYFIYSMGIIIKKYALKNASGSTFLEISGRGLSEMLLLTPSLKEQAAIGGFFYTMDNQITALSEKVERLKELKAAYLQNMFV